MIMTNVQRRNLLNSARDDAEARVVEALLPVFAHQWKYLNRELRRGNLRRTLSRTDGKWVPDKGEWDAWALELSSTMAQILSVEVGPFRDIESRFFESRGRQPLAIHEDAIVPSYQVRNGRDFSDIVKTTLERIAAILLAWYLTRGSFSDLMDNLEYLFHDKRVEMIVATELGFVEAEVAQATMEHYSVEDWIWDATMDYKTCAFCADKHGQLFHRKDPMPPDAAHPDCRCRVMYVGAGDAHVLPLKQFAVA